MKKMIFTIAVGVLCMFATSCSNKFEDAYMAENLFKYYKDLSGGGAAALQYKEQFVELYTSMTEEERARYKSYREHMDKEARELRAAEEKAEAEAKAMLGD